VKHIVSLFLALLCLLPLAGCGKGAPAVPAEPAAAAPTAADTPAETVASFTDEAFRIRVEVTLPDRWAREEGAVRETYPPISEGIVFYPKDDPAVRVTLLCYPEGFGMCGTGVEFSELTLREDLAAQQGVERYSGTPSRASGTESVNYGMFTLCFHDVPGSYVAQFELTTAQEAEYYDTIIAILATAQLGPEDAMRESHAIELAQAEYAKSPDLPEPDQVFGRYGWEDGSWTVNFYCAEAALSFSYLVDAQENVSPIRSGEPMKTAPASD